jgi:hypothetical protein
MFNHIYIYIRNQNDEVWIYFRIHVYDVKYMLIITKTWYRVANYEYAYIRHDFYWVKISSMHRQTQIATEKAASHVKACKNDEILSSNVKYMLRITKTWL